MKRFGCKHAPANGEEDQARRGRALRQRCVQAAAACAHQLPIRARP